jgi:hypothetical protein
MKLKDWIRDVRGSRQAEEIYVDSSDAPTEPEGPYRARLAAARHEPVVEGIDVSEREVVKGALQVFYRTRCPCGHHWDATDFHRMSLCPKCNRAVLLEAPTLPTG